MNEPDTSPAVPLAYAPRGDRNPLGALTVGEAAILAVRVLGLYFILEALPILSAITMIFFSSRPTPGIAPEQILTQLSYPFFYGAIGIVLLTKSSWVACRMLGVASWPGESPLHVSARQLQAVGLSIFGVILAISGAEDFIRGIVTYLRAEVAGDVIYRGAIDLATLASGMFKLFVGVWLFVGSKRLSVWWQKIRSTAPNPTANSGTPACDGTPQSDVSTETASVRL